MGELRAFVRTDGITSLNKARGGLGASEDHGKRLDEVSRQRIINKAGSLNWSKAGNDRGLDLIDAFKAHKKELGAKERKNCQIGTHVLVGVSPEWLAEAGDVHDPKNERIQFLINQAKLWAESWMGEGAVFAWRFDLDEKGSGVVDLFAAPVREQGRRGSQRVLTIAPSQAKRELTAATGEKTSGAAMQTSWAEWAQNHLDPRLTRGKRKRETGRDHIHAELYGEAAEKAKAKAAQDADRGLEELRRKEAKFEKAKEILRAEIADAEAAADHDDYIQKKRIRIDELAQQSEADRRAAAKARREAEEERDKHQDEIRRLQAKHDDLNQRNSALKNRHEKLIHDYHELAAEKQKLQHDLQQSREHVENLQSENQWLQTALEKAQELLEAVREEFALWKSLFQSLFPAQFQRVEEEIEPDDPTPPPLSSFTP